MAMSKVFVLTLVAGAWAENRHEGYASDAAYPAAGRLLARPATDPSIAPGWRGPLKRSLGEGDQQDRRQRRREARQKRRQEAKRIARCIVELKKEDRYPQGLDECGIETCDAVMSEVEERLVDLQENTVALAAKKLFEDSPNVPAAQDRRERRMTRLGAEAARAPQAHRRMSDSRHLGMCEDMCKEVGAYPNCSQCEGFVPPDSTPGVMTWGELLDHMDNLVHWGHDQLKAWRKQASQ